MLYQVPLSDVMRAILGCSSWAVPDVARMGAWQAWAAGAVSYGVLAHAGQGLPAMNHSHDVEHPRGAAVETVSGSLACWRRRWRQVWSKRSGVCVPCLQATPERRAQEMPLSRQYREQMGQWSTQGRRPSAR